MTAGCKVDMPANALELPLPTELLGQAVDVSLVALFSDVQENDDYDDFQGNDLVPFTPQHSVQDAVPAVSDAVKPVEFVLQGFAD